MRHTVIVRKAARPWVRVVLLCWVALLTLSLVAILPVGATTYPALSVEERVYDPADLLTSAQATKLTDHMNQLSAENGVGLYLATYQAKGYYDDFIGDEYCSQVRDLWGEDAILLIITYDTSDGCYYYDMYTYGHANSAINQKEVNYVLDNPDVYDNLKGGNLAPGATAFFTWSAKAYDGRVGISYAIIFPVCLVIASVIGFFVCLGVAASYRKRRPSVDYPLDRYAKLALTDSRDIFAGKSVTRTYIPPSNSSSGSRGGGSSHGGGGGHRGGR